MNTCSLIEREKMLSYLCQGRADSTSQVGFLIALSLAKNTCLTKTLWFLRGSLHAKHFHYSADNLGQASIWRRCFRMGISGSLRFLIKNIFWRAKQLKGLRLIFKMDGISVVIDLIFWSCSYLDPCKMDCHFNCEWQRSLATGLV